MEENEPRVVVGVDGSAGSRLALRFALSEAARRRVGLRVVSAHPPSSYWVGEWDVSPPDVAGEIETETRRRAQAVLDEALEGPAAAGAAGAVPVEVVVAVGSPATVLVEQSRRAELLVVGHRGRGGLASVVLGSVGLGCVLHAECPVTVVPGPAVEQVREPAHSVADSAAAPMY